MNKNNSTKHLVLTGLFGALTVALILFVKIPIPNTQGYVNLSDSLIFLSALYLPAPFALLAAAIGGLLGDFFAGAAIYIIPTVLIKGTMGFLASKALYNKEGFNIKKTIIISLVLEIIMVLGYFLFELLVYGFAVSMVSLPFNLMQGAFATVINVFVMMFAVKRVKA